MTKEKRSIQQQATYWLGVAIVGLVVGVGIQFTQAWTNPTTTAPGGNVAGPITTGGDQVKSGGLGLASLAVTGSASVGGRVKIGNIADNTCNATVEGTQRYNSTNKKMEFCNGTSWQTIVDGAVGPMKLFGGKWCSSCPYGYVNTGTLPLHHCKIKNQNGVIVNPLSVSPMSGGYACMNSGEAVQASFSFWSY